MRIDAVLSRFSLRAKMGGIIVLFAAVIAVITVELWTIAGDYREVNRFDRKVTRLTERVARLDEVLTMSARMAAATGESQWLARYREHVPKMTATLDALRELAPQRFVATFNERTAAANETLVELETRAIDRIEAGKLEAAREILQGEGYGRLKDELTQATDSFTQSLNDVAAERRQSIDARATTFIAVALAGFALATAIALIVANKTTRGLDRAIRALDALSHGDTSQTVSADGRDESARLAAAYERLREAVQSRHDLERRQREETRRREQRHDAMNQLVGIFGASIGGVLETVNHATSEMKERAAELQQVAEKSAVSAQEVTNEVSNTSESAQTVQSATDEMVSSIQEINQQISQSDAIANDAADQATQSKERVQELRTAANEIEEVIQLINDIAEKTNLLALNATIEAARAGEAGKGFAVVADEVKSLANQTSKATEQIREQIRKMQETTSTTADSITSITETLQQLREYTGGISSAMTEQEATTQDIAKNIHSVTSSAENINHNITNLQSGIEEVSAASDQVTEDTEKLADEAKTLQDEVKTFLNAMQQEDESSQEQYVPRDLKLDVKAGSGRRAVETRTLQVTPAHLLLDTELRAEPGERVAVEVPALGGKLEGRVAKTEGGRTSIQLPLDPDHIDRMRRAIDQVPAAA